MQRPLTEDRNAAPSASNPSDAAPILASLPQHSLLDIRDFIAKSGQGSHGRLPTKTPRRSALPHKLARETHRINASRWFHQNQNPALLFRPGSLSGGFATELALYGL